jgi:hypothetical protein
MRTASNKKAEFRFYEELNDFLPKEKRKRSFTYQFYGNPTIKDALEASGVPHPEIEIIVVNGISVGYDYHLTDGDRVAIYPIFESLDISPLVKLRDKPLRETKFIIDINLGKLVRFLRLLGFDSSYDNSFKEEQIIHLSSRDKRIILTRDRELLKHKTVTHGYWLRNTDPSKQLKEVIRRFDLMANLAPFTRCISCNGILKSVEKKKIINLIPAETKKYFTEFYQCNSCNKIYWPGSHYQKMLKKIEKLKEEISD